MFTSIFKSVLIAIKKPITSSLIIWKEMRWVRYITSWFRAFVGLNDFFCGSEKFCLGQNFFRRLNFFCIGIFKILNLKKWFFYNHCGEVYSICFNRENAYKKVMRNLNADALLWCSLGIFQVFYLIKKMHIKKSFV